MARMGTGVEEKQFITHLWIGARRRPTCPAFSSKGCIGLSSIVELGQGGRRPIRGRGREEGPSLRARVF